MVHDHVYPMSVNTPVGGGRYGARLVNIAGAGGVSLGSDPTGDLLSAEDDVADSELNMCGYVASR